MALIKFTKWKFYAELCPFLFTKTLMCESNGSGTISYFLLSNTKIYIYYQVNVWFQEPSESSCFKIEKIHRMSHLSHN